MAPKKPTSAAAPAAAPASGARRSARTSAAPPSAAKTDEEKKGPTSKKRAADDAPKSATASKKAKASPSKAAAPAPKSQPKSTAKAAPKSQPKSKGATEAKANGTASEKAATSKKETGEAKAAAKEKEEEAPADEAPSTDGPVLKQGEKLPSIKLQNEEGKEVDVSKLAGAKGVVLFLYPKADTPGCTAQACGFRDAYDDITKLGYDIYGLSKDTANAQKKWKDKKNLNYHLLCDPESKLIKRLGAFVEPKNTKRSHFIFEKGSGKLVEIALGVKPADDPSNVLKFIKAHK